MSAPILRSCRWVTPGRRHPPCRTPAPCNRPPRRIKLTPLGDEACRQHWWGLGNAPRIERGDGTPRREVPIALDRESAQLRDAQPALAKIERHPALVTQVRRNAE